MAVSATELLMLEYMRQQCYSDAGEPAAEDFQVMISEGADDVVVSAVRPTEFSTAAAQLLCLLSEP